MVAFELYVRNRFENATPAKNRAPPMTIWTQAATSAAGTAAIAS
jgi:hypothetical protein